MEKKLEKPTNEVKPVKTPTVAEQIWKDIMNVKLDIFALPNQKVHMYCEPVNIEPSKLYLNTKAQAVLPALEEALKGVYLVDRQLNYITVSKV